MQDDSKKSTRVSLSARPRHSDQTTKFDKDDGSPVASPLDSLESVLSWTPGTDELCEPIIPLRDRPSANPMHDPSAPKLIVCHDMMGGYTLDRFVQGHRSLEDYYFYHWQYIGAFIYFSHHFITLPPPTWTNVAHRHGVLSMGTIITEWQDGARLCHRLLGNEGKVVQFAQQLVAIAQYYQIDGWLVNIENPIHPAHVDNLHMLLSLLTSGMHADCPGSKVIWYDSVTVAGDLKWQNQLNQLNQTFFSLCDGIFLNYIWNEVGLKSTSDLAKERKGEVYVGIDVFGRGCYGGGGYNSCKALEVIHRHGMSAALFAPGWVFETQDKSHFFQSQDMFWSLLSPYCSTTILNTLPLVSSFGRGCGKSVVIDGKVVFVGEWTNLSAQDVQPTFTNGAICNDPQSAIKIDRVNVDMSTAYNNGACLKLQGTVRSSGSNKPSVVRLFKTDFSLKHPLLLAYTFKHSARSAVSHFLQLQVAGRTMVLLDPYEAPSGHDGASLRLLPEYQLPLSLKLPLPSWCEPTDLLVAPLPEPHCSDLHNLFTGSSEQREGWKTSYFLLHCDEIASSCVSEISVAVCPAASGSVHSRPFVINIGEIKVLDPSSVSPILPSSTITNLQCQDVQHSDNAISLTLTWHNHNQSDPVEHCNVYCSSIIGNPADQDSCWKGDYVFIGRAYASCYRVIGLFLLSTDLKENPFSFEFRVQPVTSSWRKPSVEMSKSLLVRITP